MKIFGWMADVGGCGWYRMVEPLRALAETGHTTHASTGMSDQWRDEADVIIGQRITRSDATEVWRRLDVGYYGRRPKLVYDIDDDLLNVDPANQVAYNYCRQPVVRANLIDNIVRADLVTVTTPQLADQVAALNPHVVVIPNYIPRWLLRLPAIPPPTGRVTVGWAGTPSHVGDFDDVAGQLTRFLRRNPHVEYHSVGRPPHRTTADLADPLYGLFPVLRTLPPDQVRTTPWRVALPDYYAALDFHVGIAPLRPTLFNRSKSHVKALEFAARGIPVIATNHGPYADFVRHGTTGLLVDRPHEWIHHLRALTSDESMRTEMAAHAYAYAATQTIEDHATEWEKALC